MECLDAHRLSSVFEEGLMCLVVSDESNGCDYLHIDQNCIIMVTSVPCATFSRHKVLSFK